MASTVEDHFLLKVPIHAFIYSEAGVYSSIWSKSVEVSGLKMLLKHAI